MSARWLLFILLAACLPLRAEDLGTIGPTYAIGEPHLLNDLQRRLNAKQASGELLRLSEQWRERGLDAVRHPSPVADVTHTRVPRTHYFDPSFALDRNVLDAEGRLLFAAGTRKNPLDVVSLSFPLLFLDGRDPRQRDQARRLIAEYRDRLRPVLVGGSYLELMRAWQRPVYYDQQGRLTRRLGIAQVPALVRQEGDRLRIDELAVAEDVETTP